MPDTPEYTITLTPYCGKTSVLPDRLRFGPDVEHLTIDASRLMFADPLFLVRMQLILDWRSGRGQRTTVVAPEKLSVGHYLRRMKIGYECNPDLVTCGLPDGAANDQSDVLIEPMKLRSQEEGDRLDDALFEVLNAHFNANTAGLAGTFSIAISEMVDNAVTHGKSSCGAYVAAQRYQGSRCVLAIADVGVGVPEHLRTAIEIEPAMPDHAVIRHAMTEQVTGSGEAGRGWGYQHILDEAGIHTVPELRMDVWAGKGVTRTFVTDGVVTTQSDSVAQRTPGTFVRVELDSKRG